MSNGGELAKNTAVIAVGKIATQMVSFFLLPLYTAVLSTEDYGVVDLVTTYVQLLLPIVTCQLEQSIFRFLLENRKDEDSKKEILSDIYTLTVAVTAIFSLIYLCMSPFIQSQYKYMLLLNLLANVYVALMLQTARGFGMNAVYATGSFISASGQVVLNVLLVLILRFGANGMLISMFVAYMFSGVYLTIATKAYHYIRFVKIDKNRIKPYLKYSLPLVPNVISWWILNASDRTIILKFINVSANGIYSAANKFSGIYTTIYNIFNLSWTESVALHLHENSSGEEFTKLQSTVIKFFSCAFLGLTAIMPFVFKILVNEKFGAAYYQIPILLAGAFFSAMTGVLGAYYVAEKMTSVIARMTIMAAILNIVVNLMFIRSIGLYAASISTLIAYLTVFILRYLDVRKRFGIKIELNVGLGTILMTVIVWLAYYSQNTIWCVITFVAVCVYSLIMNLPLLKSMIEVINKKIQKR